MLSIQNIIPLRNGFFVLSVQVIIQLMPFSILVPVGLLSYFTLSKYSLTNEIPYGKWAFMIIFVYFFNLVNWVFPNSYLFLFLDLTVKLSIPFIPNNINQMIEQRITALHLEIWLDQVRCWMITAFHKYYWKVTQYLLSKMELNESKQFKQGMVLKLNEMQENAANKLLVFKLAKSYQNTGVNCQKLNTQIAETISETAKKLEYYSKKVANQKSLHNQTFGQIKLTKQSRQFEIQVKKQMKGQQMPKFNYSKREMRPFPTNLSKNQNPKQSKHMSQLQQNQLKLKLASKQNKIYAIQSRQSHKVLQSQHVIFESSTKKVQQQQPRYNQKKISQAKRTFVAQQNQVPQDTQLKRTYTFTDYTSLQATSKPQKYMKAYREDGDMISQDLLNKLDLSVSEYSDMFQGQQDDEDLNTLECKVQVILQIGIGASVRLEIYNLELYFNRELRIVSLYNRQFEKHRLKSIKSLVNGYYELHFIDGKISSRKCKFRGQHQPFMKYLEQ